MKDNNSRFILEEQNVEFKFRNKKKSYLDIKFNRIAFIFFVFFVVSIIYSIHLIHLGSRKSVLNTNKLNISDLVKRADIIDEMRLTSKSNAAQLYRDKSIEIIDQKNCY